MKEGGREVRKEVGERIRGKEEEWEAKEHRDLFFNFSTLQHTHLMRRGGIGYGIERRERR